MYGLIKVGLSLAATAAAGLGIKAWWNRHIYGKDGFNQKGFDKEGYSREGYNKLGYDRSGFDRNGFNSQGFNREGFNAQGYDCHGYNKDGWNKYGYNRTGYDHQGYDRFGYNVSGYNPKGLDRCGHTVDFYEQKISEMVSNQLSAHKQMKLSNFNYALRDIRVGIEKGVKCILAHKLGKGYENNTLDYNIKICSREKLLDQDFISKLFSAKMHCNDTAHEDMEKEYNQVHFSYKVLCEITDQLKMMAIPATYSHTK